MTAEPVSCPVCGDTYGDLWEHLSSGRKGCGPQVIARAALAEYDSADAEAAELGAAVARADALADMLADRVFDKLRAGLLGLPPEARATLKRIGSYVAPSVSIGYGEHYLYLDAVVQNNGELWLRLTDNTRVPLWNAVLQ